MRFNAQDGRDAVMTPACGEFHRAEWPTPEAMKAEEKALVRATSSREFGLIAEKRGTDIKERQCVQSSHFVTAEDSIMELLGLCIAQVRKRKQRSTVKKGTLTFASISALRCSAMSALRMPKAMLDSYIV